MNKQQDNAPNEDRMIHVEVIPCQNEDRMIHVEVIPCQNEDRMIHVEVIPCQNEDRMIHVEVRQVEPSAENIWENYEGSIGFQLPVKEKTGIERMSFVSSPNGDF